jgi:hypothetical protein
MDRGDVKNSNLKYGSGDGDGDGGDDQKFEIENVSNTDAISTRQKPDNAKPKREESRSKRPATKQDLQEARTSYLWIPFIVVIVAIVATLIMCICKLCDGSVSPEKVLSPSNAAVTKSEIKQDLSIGIQQISDEFPSQMSKTWQMFSAGIKEVQKTPTKPSLFLLLHETEEWMPVCLAWKIGNISAHFLNATNPDPVILYGADIENNQTLVEDYGILLHEYRPKVEERCAMIVKDLHKIPGTVAQSFHWFCDTVTPLVHKAVYLFTMKVSRVGHAKDNPYILAEKELKRTWNGQLDEDKLIPLIARITDTVMMIMPEENPIPCPSGTIIKKTN